MLSSSVRASKSDTSNSENNFSRRESLSRVLPKSHNNVAFSRHVDDTLHKLIHQEYVIIAEYKMLLSENIEGIYIIPSKENPFVWFGVIFVRSGIYENGIFRFNIVLPDNFPDGGHPKVVFLSELIHPVINSTTNEVHLLDGFPVWNRNEQHIWQVVRYIHWIFYNFTASLAHTINHDAANLYRNNAELYCQRVTSYVNLSQQKIEEAPNNEDEHYFRIDPNINDNYETIKESMIRYGSQEKMTVNGYSWVTSGSYKPLSRRNSTEDR